jgi:hypothetical protein
MILIAQELSICWLSLLELGITHADVMLLVTSVFLSTLTTRAFWLPCENELRYLLHLGRYDDTFAVSRSSELLFTLSWI